MNLIQRSQTGDLTAFSELFEQYKNLVYRTAWLMLEDTHAAEDVLQEVFLRVYRNLHLYQPEKGAFTTWLHQITVNYCLNQRRSRPFIFVPFSQLLNRKSAPSHFLTQEPGHEDVEIRQALHQLSPKLRSVIILRFYWNLSYAEIAQVLALPIGTVQSRLNQAIGRLRHSLNQVDPEILREYELSQPEEVER